MKALPTALFTCFLCFSALAQDQYDFDYEIQSEAFKKERKFYVHVPEDYYLNDTDTFGVVYVLDGQGRSFFNNAKSIIDYLVWSYQITPVIVVGIHSDNRSTEFIPKDRSLAEDSPENRGEAHLLKEHIEKEIFPIIAEKYRVTQFRALIGHSRGGAFVANTLFSDQRDMFNAYLGISPGMHYLNNQILNDAREMIVANTTFNKFYYCTHGTVGSLEKYFKPQVALLDSLFTEFPNNTVMWGKKEFVGTSHWGCVAPSLVYGLLEMNRAFQVDQYLVDQFADNEAYSIAEQIEAHYKRQKEVLGYTIPPHPPLIRRYGNEQSEYGNHAKAIELYDISIKLDPDQVRTHWNKAWAHKELGQMAKAKKAFKNTMEVVEVNKSGLEAEEVDRWKERIQAALVELK